LSKKGFLIQGRKGTGSSDHSVLILTNRLKKIDRKKREKFPSFDRILRFFEEEKKVNDKISKRRFSQIK